MKKTLLSCLLLLFTSRLFAQQFSQYNTGTLFDSFENPSQRSFIPDSSRRFASNFLLPNFDGNFYLTGDAQQTLKNRLVYNNYQNSLLQVGGGNHFNRITATGNAYPIMFKMFTSLDGNVEIGFFAQTKSVMRGTFTDETIALFNGSAAFNESFYSNVLNSRYSIQTYNQYGATYREQITKQYAFGIKLAAVSGMSYQNVNINSSQIVFDKVADTATLALTGTNHQAGFSYLPFSNPGVSVSIGNSYKTLDGFLIQANVKDLGFIHWNKRAELYSFNTESTIFDLTGGQREADAYNAYKKVSTAKKVLGAFNTPLDGRAELSANKSFWLDADDADLSYSPTLIASKELFYTGFTAALVNPIQYRNKTLSLVMAYDDQKLFNFGAQFMVKGPNSEFFIASDRIFQSISFIMANAKVRSQVNKSGQFTGADLMIGTSFKFGSIIEHPLNASTIPMGDEKGFLGRLWQKWFKPSDAKALQE